MTDAEAFQKEQAGNLKLSALAKDFIQSSIRHRQNNRRKFIGLNMIIPLSLAVFLGVVAAREIRISQLWATVDAAKGQKESPARILALQELINLGVSLATINLEGANLYSADLYDADLNGANLNGANLEGANLIRGNLNNANLLRADLEGASLSAILNGANLNGAILNGATLYSANLEGASLNGAILGCIELPSEKRCTNFRGVENLTPEQVKSARNWQQAIYDEEFRKKLGLPPEK